MPLGSGDILALAGIALATELRRGRSALGPDGEGEGVLRLALAAALIAQPQIRLFLCQPLTVLEDSLRALHHLAQLEHDLFRREIAQSNDAYVRARRNLSAIIANHLLSSIDAFATVRVIQAAGGEMRLSASIPVR